jgi:hypothetical protein
MGFKSKRVVTYNTHVNALVAPLLEQILPLKKRAEKEMCL